MKNISQSYGWIINLRRAADHHRANCNESDCGVSLYQLREIANHLMDSVWPNEQTEVQKLYDEWPII